jgi:DNA-binding MarR family transcriptional regulator
MDRRCWRLHLTDASRPLMNEIDSQLGQLACLTTQDVEAGALISFADSLERMRESIAADLATEPPPP